MSLFAKHTVISNLRRFFCESGKRFTLKIDPIQEVALKEECYLVDKDDKITGTLSKHFCHLVGEDGSIPLHRAFSVFLFTERGQLILQKRSSTKITYPNYYTNTCCSHPLADIQGEDEDENAIGIKRAAQRRLNYELGIPIEQIPFDKMNYITRIHYKDLGNGYYGEHEIDYIIFMKANVTLVPNPNEVSEISFINFNGMENDILKLKPITPWFQFILEKRLHLWWNNLDAIDQFKDHQNITKF